MLTSFLQSLFSPGNKHARGKFFRFSTLDVATKGEVERICPNDGRRREYSSRTYYHQQEVIFPFLIQKYNIFRLDQMELDHKTHEEVFKSRMQ